MTKQSNNLHLSEFLSKCLIFASLSTCYGLKAQEMQPEVTAFRMELLGTTKPLRELIKNMEKNAPATTNPVPATGSVDNELMFDHATLSPLPSPGGQITDPLFKNKSSQMPPTELVPLAIFDGADYSTANDLSRPDANGDMGENCFIQTTNTSQIRIFDRQGVPITGPLNTNILWNQVGKSALFDPVISYDETAGQWLLTEVGYGTVALLATSVTSDPLDAWNIYYIPNSSIDYPQTGIWPGTFVLTTIESDEWPVYLINRSQMLAGAAYVDVQRISIPHLPNNPARILTPFDWNGHITPPTDEVFVARLKDADPASGESDKIEVWGFKPDWMSSGQTTISLTSVNTSPYDLYACATPVGFYDCIPQPGNDPSLNSYHSMIFTKVHCRSFGTHESAVLSFDANPGNYKSGIRWAELRRQPGASWTLFQEGMVATQDGEFRFMSNIAINERGDIGLGYAVSGDSTYPSARVTGRKSEDPPGEMTVTEYEIATGAGALEQNHYGDYFSMTTDPADGSFWYTGEYVLPNRKFATKIAGFRLRMDSLDLGAVALSAPQNDVLLTENELVTVSVKNYGIMPVQDFSVGYEVDDQPAVIEPAIITQLQPDSVYTHTFTVKANLGTPGKYGFKIFVTAAADQHPFNDTLRVVRHKLPRHDAAIAQVYGLDNGICSPEKSVQITIRNGGSDTLHALQLTITLNGQAPQVLNWNGILEQGQKDTVEVLLSGFQNGNNAIVIKAAMPNGTEDERPGNDIYERIFKLDFEQSRVFFTLKTDNFPEQTSWQLRDEAGQLYYAGGPYPTQQQQQELSEEWCLQTGICYNFQLHDSAGNGMEPSGSYTIRDKTGTLLSNLSTQDFGSDYYADICRQALCGFELNTVVTDVSQPPYNSGEILVEITGGIPPFQYSRNGGQSFQASPLFTGLFPGNYKIVAKDQTACSQTETVKVNLVSATDHPEQQYLISINPNPAADGIFHVVANGFPHGSDRLDINVTDAQGKQVFTQSFVVTAGAVKGVIALKDLPSGAYFACFQYVTGNKTVMLMKI